MTIHIYPVVPNLECSEVLIEPNPATSSITPGIIKNVIADHVQSWSPWSIQIEPYALPALIGTGLMPLMKVAFVKPPHPADKFGEVIIYDMARSAEIIIHYVRIAPFDFIDICNNPQP